MCRPRAIDHTELFPARRKARMVYCHFWYYIIVNYLIPFLVFSGQSFTLQKCLIPLCDQIVVNQYRDDLNDKHQV